MDCEYRKGDKIVIAVAIDGPAGAGKSSIARKTAKEIEFIYVDTGALYRAVGLHMLNCGIVPEDQQAVSAELAHVDISLEFKDGDQRVLLCGQDVTDLIRTSDVSRASSQVSAIPEVRAFLLALQTKLAEKNHVIMDGRDIGTVVLPNAQVKVFLTATPQERARRRMQQIEEKGQKADFDTILREIQERDYRDAHREIAPLIPAADAVVIDTTNLTMQQASNMLKQLIVKQIDSDKNSH